jgi:predicted regulator of Ras-like GTPase activity (Roadblock/LC7/MglB family)
MTSIVNNAPPLLTTTAALAEPEEDHVAMTATVIGGADALMSEIEGGEGEAEEVSQSEIVLEVVT